MKIHVIDFIESDLKPLIQNLSTLDKKSKNKETEMEKYTVITPKNVLRKFLK